MYYVAIARSVMLKKVPEDDVQVDFPWLRLSFSVSLGSTLGIWHVLLILDIISSLIDSVLECHESLLSHQLIVYLHATS